MVLKTFTTFISKINFFSNKSSPIILGRWKIEYCEDKISNKVNWANDDHCGACGSYMLKKLDSPIKTEKKEKND